MTAAAIGLAAVGLLLTALDARKSAAEREPATTPSTDIPNARAGLRILHLASFVAGGHRSHLREEWASVLAGDPGNGIVLSRRRRLRYALGFLWAALRMRLRDLTAPLWTPVDWLLSVETRTHAFITLAVGAQVVYTEYEDGFHTLVTEGWGWCAGCGIALRLFVGRLRRIRRIELASAHSDSNDVKHPVTTGPERSRARQSVPWTGGRQKERGLDVLLNDGTHSDSRGVKGRCHRGHRASTGSALVERRQ
ncbi:hypothetical protein [Streptomyces sp. NBC_01518]|uniref:hypothetical protein n=1 Tax=Streptomyces sp. NBC_01518 TaxID=2903891 RepID=UPI00386611B8